MSAKKLKKSIFDEYTPYFEARKIVSDIDDFEHLSFSTCVPLGVQIIDLKDSNINKAQDFLQELQTQFFAGMKGEFPFSPVMYWQPEKRLKANVYEMIDTQKNKNSEKDFQVIVRSKEGGMFPPFQVSRFSFLEAYESGLLGHINELYGKLSYAFRTFLFDRSLFSCTSNYNMSYISCKMEAMVMGQRSLNLGAYYNVDIDPIMQLAETGAETQPFEHVYFVKRLHDFIKRIESLASLQKKKFQKGSYEGTASDFYFVHITESPEYLYKRELLQEKGWFKRLFLLGTTQKRSEPYVKYFGVLLNKPKYSVKQEGDELETAFMTHEEFKEQFILPFTSALVDFYELKE